MFCTFKANFKRGGIKTELSETFHAKDLNDADSKATKVIMKREKQGFVYLGGYNLTCKGDERN